MQNTTSTPTASSGPNAAQFTRAQYMAKECSHAEYYGQFITPAIRSRVASVIGAKRIAASKDEHLNDIALASWDSLSQYPEFRTPLRTALATAGDHLSLSGVVCVAKVAARTL